MPRHETPNSISSVAQNIDNISNNLKTRGIGVIAEAYEQYQKEVAKAEALAYKGEAGKVVMDKINELAQIFAQVTQNDIKELPMFMKDSEALKKTAAFAALNAEHIRFGDYSESITVKEFVDAAKKYMNPDHFEEGERAVEKAVNSDQAAANELFNSFDWRKLGTMFYSLGYKPIQSQFLYGPLATQRRRLAQKVSVEEIHTDPEQSTSHMVRSIYRQLVTKSAEERLNFFVFFLNPLSFAQSVENLFYISFLVRDGKIRLDSDEEGTPYVEVLDEGDTVDDGASISHHIANFDHTIWRQLVAQYNITEPFIPHRDVPEDEDLPSTP
ncbi:hypothetical protein CJJ09_004989 [Candidozyma auris]|nr:hypothetical protein CJJ09_004989 [[Candida] auris]